MTAAGLLPAGIHDTTLEEIRAIFGTATPRRTELFNKLVRFHADVLSYDGLFDCLYIDGSFVTNKPDPRDIDIVLEYSEANLDAIEAHSKSGSVMDADQVGDDYGHDLHLFPQMTGDFWPDFFQKLRPEEALLRRVPARQLKGILKVAL